MGLNRIQEALVMGLMIILVFVLFSNVDLMYKIGIGVMVFTLIVLASVAAQVLNQVEEKKQF